MKDFWNERYAEPGFAYGTEPNEYLKSRQEWFEPGMKALVVGDGEGRNGVWLASLGVDVTTVDYSQSGVKKAQQLAEDRGVKINAICADLHEWDWPQNEFDIVAAVYLHFPSDVRGRMHEKMLQALKPGGVLVMEAFNQSQLEYNSGGPPVLDMLFSAEALRQDFAQASIIELEEKIVLLDEGPYHSGEGAVVRLFLKKK